MGKLQVNDIKLLEELKENYKVLGKDNLNKIIDHLKIKKIY